MITRAGRVGRSKVRKSRTIPSCPHQPQASGALSALGPANGAGASQPGHERLPSATGREVPGRSSSHSVRCSMGGAYAPSGSGRDGQCVILGIGAFGVFRTPTAPLTMSPKAWVTKG